MSQPKMDSTLPPSSQLRPPLGSFPLALSWGWQKCLDAPKHCVLTLCLHHSHLPMLLPITSLTLPPIGTGLFVSGYIIMLVELGMSELLNLKDR